jgi:glycosyltransferase involved in cell wall biosynthesis
LKQWLQLALCCYDCPCGPRAIINTDEDGFLVQDGNEDDFVEKLNRLIEEVDLRKSVGSKAAESVSQYDSDTIMNKWNDLFLQLVIGN